MNHFRFISLLIFILCASSCGEEMVDGPSDDGFAVDGQSDTDDASDSQDSEDAEEVDTYVDPCLSKDCEHKHSCIDGACKDGECVYTPNAATCTDNNVCTVDDYCVNSICKPGFKKECSDGNHCTDDSCDPKVECLFANNSKACDDANICTKTDVCVGGVCKSTNPLKCSDDNVCTFDSCDKDLGCVYKEDNLPCDDGNVCTVNDKCKNAECHPGKDKDCDDGNVCTTETCDKKFGCISKKNILPCDDKNYCTKGEYCDNGLCLHGKIVNCDDKNPCTADSCSQKKNQCENTPKQYAVCDDADECTVNDFCLDKKCKPGKSIGCCKSDSDCKGSPFGVHCSYLSALNVAAPKKSGLCNICKETSSGSTCDVGHCLLSVQKIDKTDRAKLYCSGDSLKLCKNDSNLCTLEKPDFVGTKEVCGSLKIDCDDNNKCTADLCDANAGWCSHMPVPGCK